MCREDEDQPRRFPLVAHLLPSDKRDHDLSKEM